MGERANRLWTQKSVQSECLDQQVKHAVWRMCVHEADLFGLGRAAGAMGRLAEAGQRRWQASALTKPLSFQENLTLSSSKYPETRVCG